MAQSHDSSSARPAKPAKPPKPNPDFPLYRHASGQLGQEDSGKLHYFGTWNDPNGAEERYKAEKDALHAGRKPGEVMDGVTVKELIRGGRSPCLRSESRFGL
jgi:hypothetical protein